MLIVIGLVFAVGFAFAAFVAGRYAGWPGLVLPIALTIALGYGWEWDTDAVPLIIGVALISGLSCIAGLVQRRERAEMP